MLYSERWCGVTMFEAWNVDRCIIQFLEYRPNARDHATARNRRPSSLAATRKFSAENYP